MQQALVEQLVQLQRLAEQQAVQLVLVELLVQVELLAKNKHGAQQNHDGACGVDGAYQCEGKMFHAEVSAKPAAQYDTALQYNELLYLPSSEIGMEQMGCRDGSSGGQEDERQEDEAAEQRVEEQHGDDGVAVQGTFLENIVAT